MPPLHDARHCGAKKRQGDGTCTQPAGWGTDHPGYGPCKLHGGASPSMDGIVQEAKARDLMETYGRKIETTAVEALLDEVKWTAGHVAWLREQVRKIEESALVWGVTQVKEGGHDGGTTQAAEPSIWLKLYQAERTHLVKVCSEAIRAGIEERRVRLAEQQGELVADVIRAILTDLNLTAEQQARVPDVVPRHLRALAG